MNDWTAEQLHRKEEDESIMALLDRRHPDFAAALAKAFSQHREDTHVQEEHQAMDHLNAILGLNLSRDNVKNRLKSWKKHYAIISDITQQSGGFTWDDEKKMIVVTAENRDIWNNYVKSNPEAKGYQNKVIDNWDDIVMLCGKDRATGLGARNIEDVDEDALRGQNEVEFLNEDTNNSRPQHTQAQTSTSTHSPRQTHSKKKLRKYPFAEALMRTATSVEEYIASKKKEELASEVEIYELVSKVEGLAGSQVLQAVHRLMHGSTRESRLLKALPNDKKKEWIEILLAHPST